MNFKRYIENSDTWVDSHYIKGTDTETITTLPATIYPLAQTVTLGIKGNTVQNGTPSPSSPVDVVGVGDLDNGQFKIPILLNSQTINKYLGEVQSTRKIDKVVFTGEENWGIYNPSDWSLTRFNITLPSATLSLGLCTHYPFILQSGGTTDHFYMNARGDLYIFSTTITSTDDFKTYFQQQYAAGTPVTVWYVLATPQTATVNEPLMKIGNYADTLTTSIPCTAGENSFDVDTTVQPSEVTATFDGWHPVQSVHERSGGAWD